jgi:hypothetical protein
MTGSLSLRDYPGEMVRFACEKCGRAGQYRKQNLIKQFGNDIPLPDLRFRIANCERVGDVHDACYIHYVGLTAEW